MNKLILSVIICIVFSVEAVSAQVSKSPLPEGFLQRLDVIFTESGSMPDGMKQTIFVLVAVIAVTVIFYLIRNVKGGK